MQKTGHLIWVSGRTMKKEARIATPGEVSELASTLISRGGAIWDLEQALRHVAREAATKGVDLVDIQQLSRVFSREVEKYNRHLTSGGL